MDHHDRMHFKPRLSVLIFSTLMGIFSIILAIFLFWSLVTVNMDISVQIPLFALCMGSLLYGYYLLSFLWKLKLTVSDQGILYKEPLHTVESKWDDIKGASASEKLFILRLDASFIPHRNVIKWLHRKEEFIPIHFFVNNWQEQTSWQQNRLLKSIAYNLPGLEKEVIKDGN